LFHINFIWEKYGIHNIIAIRFIKEKLSILINHNDNGWHYEIYNLEANHRSQKKSLQVAYFNQKLDYENLNSEQLLKKIQKLIIFS
jgi:hypothetical protein